jgi:hypothetical protein
MPEKPNAAVVASASSVPVELLEQGNTLVRLENFTQASIAVQRPRDLAKIQEELIAGVMANPEYACRLIYCKPVGREEANAPMKFAEELNIRGAEAIASLYNNSSFGWEPVADDGETFTGVAVWLDYERNIRHTMTFRVAHVMKQRGGATMRIPDDRFADVVVKAAASKAVREVILRSIPPWTREALTAKVWEIIGREKGDTDELSRAFASRGVPYTRIEHLMGKKMGELRGDDVARLFGVLNALRDNELTVEQAFEESIPKDDGVKGKEVLDRVRGKKAAPSPAPAPTGPGPGSSAASTAPAEPSKTPTPAQPPTQGPGPGPAPAPSDPQGAKTSELRGEVDRRKGKRQQAEKKPEAAPAAPPVFEPATDVQQSELFALFKDRGLIAADSAMMKAFVSAKVGRKIEQTSQVSKTEMDQVIDALGALGSRQEVVDASKVEEKK